MRTKTFFVFKYVHDITSTTLSLNKGLFKDFYFAGEKYKNKVINLNFMKRYGLYWVLLIINIGLIFFTRPIRFLLEKELFLIIGFLLVLSGAIIYVYWEILWHENIIRLKKELVTKGIYSHIRHPLLLALILIFFGLPISFNSSQSLVLSVLSVILILIGSKKEEEYLIKGYGKRYKKYMEKVPYRFIPRII